MSGEHAGGRVIRFPVERRGGAPALVDMKGLCAHFGFSDRYFRYRLTEGMPCKRYGRRLRFNIAEVEQWLEGRYSELDEGA